MSNQQIKTNLETLLAAVEAQPEPLFNLSSFKTVEPCGTLFCTAGLAATMPFFIEQGVTFNERESWVVVDGVDIDGSSTVNSLFGERAYCNLFSYASGGYRDEELGYELEDGYYDSQNVWVEPVANMTDKALAIARLKRQIEIYSEVQ